MPEQSKDTMKAPIKQLGLIKHESTQKVFRCTILAFCCRVANREFSYNFIIMSVPLCLRNISWGWSFYSIIERWKSKGISQDTTLKLIYMKYHPSLTFCYGYKHLILIFLNFHMYFLISFFNIINTKKDQVFMYLRQKRIKYLGTWDALDLKH